MALDEKSSYGKEKRNLLPPGDRWKIKNLEMVIN